jgi:regulator of sigma E protease
VATPAFTELSPALLAHADKATDLGVIRGNDTIHVTATPNGAGKLGFELKSPVDIFEVKVTQYGMFEAIPVGIKDGTDFLVTYVSSLKHLFSKEGAESVGGFGAIGNMFPPKWDWRTFWEMTAFLSIILAFMNIIPIPALDGGHVAFLLWEVVTRRAPSEKFMEYAQTAGMLFLLALLIYANFNDLYRFVLK